jgi:cytochrome P450
MTIAERRPDIDLYDPASFDGGQPHDQFDWLRANDPVHRHALPDGGHFFALTRFDDVRAVGKDAATFSSEPTIMIDEPDPSTDMGDHKMMLMADPPLHTRMRRMVSRDFTPGAARRLRPRIEELAVRIVDEVVERGECDLVADIAGEMPSFVIAELLGIPLEDGRELYHLTETLHAASSAVGIEAQQAAFGQMFGYAQQVCAAKRDAPSDDLASLLATGELEGQPLDEVDFFLWFLLLVDAGGDTTRNLVGGGMHALFEHPDQLAACAPTRRPAADRHRGAPALRQPGRPHAPPRHPRTPSCGVTPSPRATAWSCTTAPPTVTPRCSTVPTSSISGGARTTTWPSAAVARTSAWAPTSPASRSTPCCARCSPASTTSPRPAGDSGWRRTSSAAPPTCRSRSGPARGRGREHPPTPSGRPRRRGARRCPSSTRCETSSAWRSRTETRLWPPSAW